MILIENGLLIDPSSNREGEFDVLIEGERIKDVQKRGSFANLQVQRRIDAKGLWVVPGLVDLHVHLREPGFEWKETIKTGAEAAVLGGYTSICCMPNTKPTNDCAEVSKFIIERGRACGTARVLPIGSISRGLQGKEMSALSELREAGCVAFSDDGEPIWDSGMMRRALEWCLMLDVPISCHEEDKNLSCGGCMNESALSTRMGLKGMPTVAEDVMIARDIELARYTGGKVHICHVSSGRSVELIRRAKNDGIRITAEVTPHHLVLTEDAVGDYDTNAKMSPPLRGEADRLALVAGLKDGTLDAIASDHAPHELDSKQVEFAKATFGILGLQTSLPLMLDFVRNGSISKLRAFDALSTSPAKVFGLPGGRLAAGAPADISLINPDYRWTFRKEVVKSLSMNSPFMGRELAGIAETVLVGGKVVVERQQLGGA
ncbi:MAG: dihydroorotase [Deltaproteobacteria bacterium]|nr:dihydroorotase [Deltaproteobacteria bacterium]